MLAIAGGKGGCGKTTTALGLGEGLAEASGRCVLVDADRDMPNLHVLAGTPRAPGVASLAAGRPVAEVVHDVPGRPDVGVVPAGAGGGDLRRALGRLRRADGVGSVLVDCPAGAGPDVATPLAAADRTLLVSTPDAESLQDAAKTAAMARCLDAAPVGVVLARADRPPSGLDRLFDAPLLGCVPEGRTIDDHAVGAAYSTLTSEVARNI